jgi:hypothetical protein
MMITLDEHDSSCFTFKIGDKVRTKFGQMIGIVSAGECYAVSESEKVFYQITLADGMHFTYNREDLELVS